MKIPVRAFWLIAIFANPILLANADDFLLRRTTVGGNGVEIQTGGWSEGRHADETYKAFKKFRGAALGEFDYYYQLRVVPQFKTTFEECKESSPIARFFNQIVGVSDASLVVLKTGVTYRWASGQPVDFIKDATPLFIIGTGAKPNSLEPGNGCFFDVTQSPTFPLLRYGGGGANQQFDDFELKFSINGGKATTINAVANIAQLFTNFNTALAWNLATSAQAAALTAAATTFQNSLQAAGTFQSATTRNYTLKQGDRVRITIPALFGASNDLIIYSRRQASIAFDTSDPQITSVKVLEKEGLAARECIPPKIAAGTCELSKSVRESIAASSFVKAIDDKAPMNIFNPFVAEKQKLIFDLCEAVRTHIREKMRLTTLDEMMVRWALTKQTKLQDALKDPVKSAVIATATGRTVSELQQSCWNDGDEKTVRGVAALLNKTLE
jgi:hypothetical protein